MVVAIEIGGRSSDEAVDVVRQLATAKAREVHASSGSYDLGVNVEEEYSVRKSLRSVHDGAVDKRRSSHQ